MYDFPITHVKKGWTSGSLRRSSFDPIKVHNELRPLGLVLTRVPMTVGSCSNLSHGVLGVTVWGVRGFAGATRYLEVQGCDF